MQNIFLTGYSNTERHATIDTVKSIVTKHGDIVDFTIFSDVSITVKIEIEEFKIDNMYNELTNAIAIDKFDYLNSSSKKERIVFLNITFNKSTGNLIIECLNVPG